MGPPSSLTPSHPVCPAEEGEYFLKVLIPSYAAGSIIGKGGQTIVQLQKETGATIKLSKSKDFYPGKPQTGQVPELDFSSFLFLEPWVCGKTALGTFRVMEEGYFLSP